MYDNFPAQCFESDLFRWRDPMTRLDFGRSLTSAKITFKHPCPRGVGGKDKQTSGPQSLRARTQWTLQERSIHMFHER